MENLIKMDELGVPLFLETPVWRRLMSSVVLNEQLVGDVDFFQEGAVVENSCLLIAILLGSRTCLNIKL